jgi:hypothetical protein
MGSAKTIMDVHLTSVLAQLAIKSRVAVLEYWFAARVGLWLCWLPIVLRAHSLPVLLQRLESAQDQHQKRSSIKIERAVEIVVRVCRMRLFDLRIFPRPCLRQSLALYHVLTRMGYPVEIKFGVHKEGNDLQGHSWVTLEGKPVADRTRTEIFKPVYSYFSASYGSPTNETETFQERR